MNNDYDDYDDDDNINYTRQNQIFFFLSTGFESTAKPQLVASWFL